MFTPINDMFVHGSGPSGLVSFMRGGCLIDGERTGVPLFPSFTINQALFTELYIYIICPIFMYNIDVS